MILQSYCSYIYHLIDKRPRTIYKATSFTCPAEVEIGLKWLEEKIRKGESVELIERTRSEKIPQVGDRLIYVDRYGRYYGNALIEKREETSGLISICEEPYIPLSGKNMTV